MHNGRRRSFQLARERAVLPPSSLIRSGWSLRVSRSGRHTAWTCRLSILILARKRKRGALSSFYSPVLLHHRRAPSPSFSPLVSFSRREKPFHRYIRTYTPICIHTGTYKRSCCRYALAVLKVAASLIRRRIVVVVRCNSTLTREGGAKELLRRKKGAREVRSFRELFIVKM